MSGNSIRATNLVGLMAYDGNAWRDPFVVTSENIRKFSCAETPEDGWVMLWTDDYDPDFEGVLEIVH